jgi:hypothetical protein
MIRGGLSTRKGNQTLGGHSQRSKSNQVASAQAWLVQPQLTADDTRRHLTEEQRTLDLI